MSGDWRGDLRFQLESFMDDLVVHGAKHSEVYAAIREELDAYGWARESVARLCTGTADSMTATGNERSPALYRSAMRNVATPPPTVLLSRSMKYALPGTKGILQDFASFQQNTSPLPGTENFTPM